MLTTIHLNFEELSPHAQKEIRKRIATSYFRNWKQLPTTEEINKLNGEISRLFKLNNAGIDIAVFPWMKV